jgi:hypothetical protein
VHEKPAPQEEGDEADDDNDDVIIAEEALAEAPEEAPDGPDVADAAQELLTAAAQLPCNVERRVACWAGAPAGCLDPAQFEARLEFGRIAALYFIPCRIVLYFGAGGPFCTTVHPLYTR